MSERGLQFIKHRPRAFFKKAGVPLQMRQARFGRELKQKIAKKYAQHSEGLKGRKKSICRTPIAPSQDDLLEPAISVKIRTKSMRLPNRTRPFIMPLMAELI